MSSSNMLTKRTHATPPESRSPLATFSLESITNRTVRTTVGREDEWKTNKRPRPTLTAASPAQRVSHQAARENSLVSSSHAFTSSIPGNKPNLLPPGTEKKLPIPTTRKRVTFSEVDDVCLFYNNGIIGSRHRFNFDTPSKSRPPISNQKLKHIILISSYDMKQEQTDREYKASLGIIDEMGEVIGRRIHSAVSDGLFPSINRIVSSTIPSAIHMTEKLARSLKRKVELDDSFRDQFLLSQTGGLPASNDFIQKFPKTWKTIGKIPDPITWEHTEYGTHFQDRVREGLDALMARTWNDTNSVIIITHPRVIWNIMGHFGQDSSSLKDHCTCFPVLVTDTHQDPNATFFSHIIYKVMKMVTNRIAAMFNC